MVLIRLSLILIYLPDVWLGQTEGKSNHLEGCVLSKKICGVEKDYFKFYLPFPSGII